MIVFAELFWFKGCFFRAIEKAEWQSLNLKNQRGVSEFKVTFQFVSDFEH